MTPSSPITLCPTDVESECVLVPNSASPSQIGKLQLPIFTINFELINEQINKL